MKLFLFWNWAESCKQEVDAWFKSVKNCVLGLMDWNEMSAVEQKRVCRKSNFLARMRKVHPSATSFFKNKFEKRHKLRGRKQEDTIKKSLAPGTPNSKTLTKTGCYVCDEGLPMFCYCTVLRSLQRNISSFRLLALCTVCTVTVVGYCTSNNK